MIALLLIALFAVSAPQTAASVDVVLLVDVSDSFTIGGFTRDKAMVTAPAGALADAIQRGDRVRIGTFGSTLALDDRALEDAAAVRDAAAALAEHLGGPSPVWDALDAAGKALEPGNRRRGIILVTDGRATGNRLGFEEVLAKLKAAHLPVFVVSLDKAGGRPIPDPGARLEQLAQQTGGVCFFVERKALPAAVTRAVATLRAR